MNREEALKILINGESEPCYKTCDEDCGKVMICLNHKCKWAEAMDVISEAVKDRPRGEWIPFEYDENCKPKPLPKGSPSEMEEYWAEEFMCSNCGGLHHWRNFCPKCGADMREGEAE